MASARRPPGRMEHLLERPNPRRSVVLGKHYGGYRLGLPAVLLRSHAPAKVRAPAIWFLALLGCWTPLGRMPLENAPPFRVPWRPGLPRFRWWPPAGTAISATNRRQSRARPRLQPAKSSNPCSRFPLLLADLDAAL